MKPQKIVLIRGIHPNELDLSKEIAAELRKQGHRVRVVKVPFRETMHWHFQHGKGKRPFKEFTGGHFVERVGFRHPAWHVVGLHSTPREHMPEVLIEAEYHEPAHHAVGHLYWDFYSEDHKPALISREGVHAGRLTRISLEIPAVYDDKHTTPLNRDKFEFADTDDQTKLPKFYYRRANAPRTFKWRSKKALVEQAVAKLNEHFQDIERINEYLRGKYTSHSREFAYRCAVRAKQSPDYDNLPVGYRKAVEHILRTKTRR